MAKARGFDRNFSLMVLGQVISILGAAILRFALDLYVLDITGRADIFATVLAVSVLPSIAFAPIGGAIADRFPRRNLMVIFDFASSATVLVLIALFAAGQPSVVAIAAVMIVLSTISAMYQPAVQASIPSLATGEQLAQANGIVNGVGALSGLLGPVLGGMLYGFLGIHTLVAFGCAAFAASAVMEIFLRIPFARQPQTRHIVPTVLGDIRDGVAYMVREDPRIVRTICVAALLNMFLSAFMVVGSPYVLRVTLRSSETMYGVGMGLIQLAGIAGALLTPLFARRMRISTLYRWLLAIAAFLLPMAAAMSGGVLGLGYWPPFAIYFGFTMAAMMAATILSVFVITDVQRRTPDAYLGKVMAIIMAVSNCAMPLGQVLYGALFERMSGRMYVPVLIAAGFTVVVALVGWGVLRERGAEAVAEAAVAEAE